MLQEHLRGVLWRLFGEKNWIPLTHYGGITRVRLNLPGEEDYDPTLPWVMSKTGTVKEGDCEHIAGDFFTYMNDIHSCGQSEDHCWEVS